MYPKTLMPKHIDEHQVFLPGCAPRGYGDQEWRPEPSARPESRAAPSPVLEVPASAPPADDSESRSRARVTGRVRESVLAFFRLRLRLQAPTFRLSELTDYVASRVPTAPDSAGRIMRQLAAEEVLGYELVSRSQSLYRATSVGGAPLEGGA